MTLLVASVAVLLLAIGVVRLSALRFFKRRVVVHTSGDRSIRGVLTGVYTDCIVVSDPEYLGEARPAELEGRVVVLRTQVDWMQVL